MPLTTPITSRSESPNFESVGLFLFATISILETVGFILSISVVEELRPRWLSLPLS